MLTFYLFMVCVLALVLIVTEVMIIKQKKKMELDLRSMQHMLNVEISALGLYEQQHQKLIKEKKLEYDLELAKWNDQRILNAKLTREQEQEYNSELVKWKEQRKLFEKVTQEKIRKKKVRGKRKKRVS